MLVQLQGKISRIDEGGEAIVVALAMSSTPAGLVSCSLALTQARFLRVCREAELLTADARLLERGLDRLVRGQAGTADLYDAEGLHVLRVSAEASTDEPLVLSAYWHSPILTVGHVAPQARLADLGLEARGNDLALLAGFEGVMVSYGEARRLHAFLVEVLSSASDGSGQRDD